MIKTYAYHKPSPIVQEVIEEVRRQFSEMHEFLDKNVSDSREKSIAFTKLEESAMWAIKGLVLNDPEAEVKE